MRKARDLGILFGDTLVCVYHNKNDIRTIHRHIRTNNAVTLDIFIDFALFAQSRSVDKHEFAVLVFLDGIDGVAGRAGNIGNKHTFFAEHIVDKRRFTDIRLSDESDLYCALVFGFLGSVFEFFYHLVKQITYSKTVNGGNAERVAETEVVKLIYFGRFRPRFINLVNAKNDLFIRFQKHLRNVGIG